MGFCACYLGPYSSNGSFQPPPRVESETSWCPVLRGLTNTTQGSLNKHGREADVNFPDIHSKCIHLFFSGKCILILPWSNGSTVQVFHTWSISYGFLMEHVFLKHQRKILLWLATTPSQGPSNNPDGKLIQDVEAPKMGIESEKKKAHHHHHHHHHHHLYHHHHHHKNHLHHRHHPLRLIINQNRSR